MNTRLRSMLEDWLINGTDIQKRHAEFRLSQSDVHLEYPSFVQQAKNVTAAIATTIASVVRGEPIHVSQEEQDRRLAICHICEFWDSGQGRCSKCACFGQFKTWLASQECPIGKWGKVR